MMQLKVKLESIGFEFLILLYNKYYIYLKLISCDFYGKMQECLPTLTSLYSSRLPKKFFSVAGLFQKDPAQKLRHYGSRTVQDSHLIPYYDLLNQHYLFIKLYSLFFRLDYITIHPGLSTIKLFESRFYMFCKNITHSRNLSHTPQNTFHPVSFFFQNCFP